jgi:CRISPR type III-A-associated protein Csm2
MPTDLKENIINIDSFFDKEGNIKKELINDFGNNNVRQLGELLTERLSENFIDRRTGKTREKKINLELNINQLRKYYDMFLRIYHSRVSEDEKKIQLLMLKGNVEYSVGRLTIKRFGIFMENRINLVVKETEEKFEKTLQAFKLHFEALVGYYPRTKDEGEN